MPKVTLPGKSNPNSDRMAVLNRSNDRHSPNYICSVTQVQTQEKRTVTIAKGGKLEKVLKGWQRGKGQYQRNKEEKKKVKADCFHKSFK